jgi:hypothetical protein
VIKYPFFNERENRILQVTTVIKGYKENTMWEIDTMEKEKTRLLAWQEEKWKLKRWNTWLAKGDDNTKIFHLQVVAHK